MGNPVQKLDELIKALQTHTETNARLIAETQELVNQAVINNQMMLDLLKESK